MPPKKTKGVSAEQIARMAARYVRDIDAHAEIMGATHGDAMLDRARVAAAAVPGALERGDRATAMQCIGFAQGVLLCRGLHTWEYLASDERRE